MEHKLFVAGKAFINNNGKILVLRESKKYEVSTNPGKYDIPGGRIEPGENLLDALKREVEEETGLKVQVGKPFTTNEWKPVVKGEQWHIVAVFFECFTNEENIRLSQDHDEFKWIKPEEYKGHNIIENLHKVFEDYLNK